MLRLQGATRRGDGGWRGRTGGDVDVGFLGFPEPVVEIEAACPLVGDVQEAVQTADGRWQDGQELFEEGGGQLLVTVGFEELEASRDLLERFGMDVVNIPLGRFEVPVEGDTLSVVFHEGWPVRFEPTAPAEVLLSVWDQPVAVKRTVGDGEIVLIGDSSFFHDVNLETLDSYFAGNVAFLREITEYDKEAEQ